jgi:hypothetical protein
MEHQCNLSQEQSPAPTVIRFSSHIGGRPSTPPTPSAARPSKKAERTEHAIVKNYTDLGYEIVRLPLANPRADFVLRHSQ